MKNKQKIIIDCDPGIDDALALMAVFGSGLFDVCAVTTVAGNSTLFNTANNARFILENLNENVPIYPGCFKPISNKQVFANVHGQEGLGDIVFRKRAIPKRDGVLKIVNILTKYPGEVSILCLGPLTNIAELILKYPEAARLIKELVIMGGAVSVHGNKTNFAEFNFFVDPEAAQIVMGSNIRKVLIPLDVCNRIKMSLADFLDLGSPLITALAKSYLVGLKSYENLNKIIPHDPVAAYFLINPKAFRLNSLRLKVSTKKDNRGQVMKFNGKANIAVAVDINKTRFTGEFLKILKGGDKNGGKRI